MATKRTTPKPQPAPQGAPVQFYIPLNGALYLCIFSHTLAAVLAPVQDCDETFNYWEPVHYLNHGYGLQTWEYSPEFSIRSWAYIALHAVPAKLAGLFSNSKIVEFYFLRVVLAMTCAATEVRLYSAISRTLNPRIAVFYLMIVAFTPGFFYASAAFLPSSFAMYTATLGLTAFMDWHGGSKTAAAIMWFGIGALLGWPFAAALIIPFVMEDWAVATVVGDTFSTFRKYLDGTVRCLIVLALQVSIDAFFYRKLTFVPLRIVFYNVFSGRDRGPNIFGVEPWHFYVRNLLLNFNIWFLLALLSFPLLAIQTFFLKHQTTKQTVLRTVTFITPFYLWLTIFTLQPHKEERFMYPCYPFLALNAAISFHMLLTWLGHANPNTLIGKIPPRVKLAVILPLLVAFLNISLLRILGTITAYSAPLGIYKPLASPNATTPGDTLCLGKDWYRFPTTHFLPSPVHAKFIKSSFTGLLPGEFHEGHTGFGWYSGAWLLPSGMNDLNQEDPGKYFDINHCTYLVDTHMPGTQASEHEPIYTQDAERWERVYCLPFLDTARTPLLPRTLWLPDLHILPDPLRRKWGEHCLLRQRKS